MQAFFSKFFQLGVCKYIIKALHHLCFSEVTEINTRFFPWYWIVPITRKAYFCKISSVSNLVPKKKKYRGKYLVFWLGAFLDISTYSFTYKGFFSPCVQFLSWFHVRKCTRWEKQLLWKCSCYFLILVFVVFFCWWGFCCCFGMLIVFVWFGLGFFSE